MSDTPIGTQRSSRKGAATHTSERPGGRRSRSRRFGARNVVAALICLFALITATLPPIPAGADTETVLAFPPWSNDSHSLKGLENCANEPVGSLITDPDGTHVETDFTYAHDDHPSCDSGAQAHFWAHLGELFVADGTPVQIELSYTVVDAQTHSESGTATSWFEIFPSLQAGTSPDATATWGAALPAYASESCESEAGDSCSPSGALTPGQHTLVQDGTISCQETIDGGCYLTTASLAVLASVTTTDEAAGSVAFVIEDVSISYHLTLDDSPEVEVSPLVDVSPEAGSVGTAFTVKATGFTANATVTTHLAAPDSSDTSTETTLTSDASGDFTDAIDTTGFEPGIWRYWAVDDSTGAMSNVHGIPISAIDVPFERVDLETDTSPRVLDEFHPFVIEHGWVLATCEDGQPEDFDSDLIFDDGLRFDLYVNDVPRDPELRALCFELEDGSEVLAKNHRYWFPEGLPLGRHELRGEWWWHENPEEPMKVETLTLEVQTSEEPDTPPSALVYAVSGPGPGSPGSQLYVIEPSADGEDTLIGAVQTAAGSARIVRDIALTHDGTMYGVRTRVSSETFQDITELYEIDAATATATLVGETHFMDVNGLEVAPDGRILGSTSRKPTFTNQEGLVEFDPDTGEATLIGSFGPDLGSSGDLAFSPGGTLYLSAREAGVSNDVLATVDPDTGAATRVNPEDDLGYSTVFGLFFVEDQLFGVTRQAPECDAGALLQIDQDAANASFVRCLAFEARGASTEPQVAEDAPVHVELLLEKVWLDADGEQTEPPAEDVVTLDAGEAGTTHEGGVLAVEEGTSYSVSENLPRGWIEVECPEEFQEGEIIGVPLDDPTEGQFLVIGNGTGHFTATETGIHVVCNRLEEEVPDEGIAVTVTPSSGIPGTDFTAVGTGFRPDTTATIVVKPLDQTVPVLVTATATDGTGSFSREIDSTEMEPATYQLWAVEDPTGVESPVVTFIVKPKATFGDPVIIVPGILGAWDNEDFNRLRRSMPSRTLREALRAKYMRAPKPHQSEGYIARLYADSGFLNWFTSLRSEPEYRTGENLFVFIYSGFEPIDQSATSLNQLISWAYDRSDGRPVTLIAHSLGGVVSREALNLGAHDDKVSRLITFGTPHEGAPVAFRPYNDGVLNEWLGALTASLMQRYIACFLTEQDPDVRRCHRPPIASGEEVATFLRDHAPGVQGLLPTFNYLAADFEGLGPVLLPGVCNAPDVYPINQVVCALDPAENSHLEGLEIVTVAGTADETVVAYVVETSNDGNQLLGRWGEITDVLMGPGDGTVPAFSASLENSVPTGLHCSTDLDHQDLAKTTGNRLVGFLRTDDPSCDLLQGD